LKKTGGEEVLKGLREGVKIVYNKHTKDNWTTKLVFGVCEAYAYL
jgi:hypothetical protein